MFRQLSKILCPEKGTVKETELQKQERLLRTSVSRYDLGVSSVPVFVAAGVINNIVELIEQRSETEEYLALKLWLLAILTYLCARILFYFHLKWTENRELKEKVQREAEKAIHKQKGNEETGEENTINQVLLSPEMSEKSEKSCCSNEKVEDMKFWVATYVTKTAVEATGFAVARLLLFAMQAVITTSPIRAASEELNASFGLYLCGVLVIVLAIITSTCFDIYVFKAPGHLAQHLAHFNMEVFALPIAIGFMLLIYLAMGLEPTYVFEGCEICEEHTDPYGYGSLSATFLVLISGGIIFIISVFRAFVINRWLSSKSGHSHGDSSALVIIKHSILQLFGSNFVGIVVAVAYLQVTLQQYVAQFTVSFFIILVIAIVLTYMLSGAYSRIETRLKKIAATNTAAAAAAGDTAVTNSSCVSLGIEGANSISTSRKSGEGLRSSMPSEEGGEVDEEEEEELNEAELIDSASGFEKISIAFRVVRLSAIRYFIGIIWEITVSLFIELITDGSHGPITLTILFICLYFLGGRWFIGLSSSKKKAEEKLNAFLNEHK